MTLRILLSIASIYLTCVGLGLIFAPQRFGVGAPSPLTPLPSWLLICGFLAAPC